jgi:hypothetical protein
MMAEDHPGGRQLIRFRMTPRGSVTATIIAGVFSGLAALAAADRAHGVALTLVAVALVIVARVFVEQAIAMGAALMATRRLADAEELVVVPRSTAGREESPSRA